MPFKKENSRRITIFLISFIANCHFLTTASIAQKLEPTSVNRDKIYSTNHPDHSSTSGCTEDYKSIFNSIMNRNAASSSRLDMLYPHFNQKSRVCTVEDFTYFLKMYTNFLLDEASTGKDISKTAYELANKIIKYRPLYIHCEPKGYVKWFNDTKGYGVIISAISKAELIIHHTSIPGEGFRTLSENQLVDFDIIKGPQGLQAINITQACVMPEYAIIITSLRNKNKNIDTFPTWKILLNEVITLQSPKRVFPRNKK